MMFTVLLPSNTDQHPFIQVDFLEPKTLSGVRTQGGGGSSGWVDLYQIRYSLDGVQWTWFTDVNGSTKTFTGNSDNSNSLTNLFGQNIVSRYFRLYPVGTHTPVGLRFNVLGCTPSHPKTTPAPTPEFPYTGSPTAAPLAPTFVAPAKG
jgi:hypothetical protein